MNKILFISLACLSLFGTGCKKKEKDPEPEPVEKPREEYGYFKGEVNGKQTNNIIFLDYNTKYTSYSSNGASINSSNDGNPSKFTYGHSVRHVNDQSGFTLERGTQLITENATYPTKKQFYDFFTVGKFPLTEDYGQGAIISYSEKSGEDFKIYQSTEQPLSDSAYVEFTKITPGVEVGTPVVYYEANFNATLIEINTGEKIVIRNGRMKGSFQPDWIQD